MLCFVYKIFERISKKEELYLPELSNEELNQIQEEQAKLIYDNAKNFLKESHNAFESLDRKADSLFKYIFAIESAILSFYIYKKPLNLEIDKTTMIIAFFVLCVITIIYCKHFLSPKPINCINNIPKEMLKQKALQPLRVFYILESVAIQRFAISKNEKQIKIKERYLKVMVYFALIIPLLIFLKLC